MILIQLNINLLLRSVVPNEIVTPSSAFHASAVSHFHLSMIVPFKTPIAWKGEAFRLWDFDRSSANDWALHTQIDVEIKWGEFYVFRHQTWNFTQQILWISRSTTDNFKNVQSFTCNLTSLESKVISKALGVNILLKW